MFQEMYEGIVEILKKGPEDEIKHMRDAGKVPYFLNLVYNFEPTDIIRVNFIYIENMPTIILALAKFPESAKHSKYSNYTIYDGKMAKLILINMNDLLDEDPMVQMISICWSIWEMTYTATETYINMFYKTNRSNASATNILYYSGAVLMIKVLTKLYDTSKLSDDILSLVINNFYSKNKILPIGVTSIKKAIAEIDIGLLLDYNLYDAMIASELSYPGAAFADVSPQEVLKYSEEVEQKSVEKNEEDTTDPV